MIDTFKVEVFGSNDALLLTIHKDRYPSEEEWLASLTAKILEADNRLLSMTITRSENQIQGVVKMDGNTPDAASN